MDVGALMAWGDRYEVPNGPPVIFEHERGHGAAHRRRGVTRRKGTRRQPVSVRAAPDARAGA